MKIRIYSFFDQVAENFTLPFYMQNDNLAIRAFRNMLTDPEHAWSKNPDDYSLHIMAEFDDTTGEIDSGYGQALIMAGSELMKGVEKK